MTEKYFIRGTIAIQAVEATTKIYITPCSNFIMPGNPKKAIAFPAPAKDADSSKLPEIARIIELTDGRKDFDAEKIKEYISSLIFISAQQKKVELRLKYIEGQSEMEIVGFVFPAP